MEKALKSTDDSLDKFVLDIVALPLEAPIWMFSEMTLNSRGLDIAELKEEMFEFAISLLSTTMQDSGTRERSIIVKELVKNNLYMKLEKYK